jgi:hypothetical protein
MTELKALLPQCQRPIDYHINRSQIRDMIMIYHTKHMIPGTPDYALVKTMCSVTVIEEYVVNIRGGRPYDVDQQTLSNLMYISIRYPDLLKKCSATSQHKLNQLTRLG